MVRGTMSKRQRTVTAEPFALDPQVRGRPLATIRRRAAAIVVDGIFAALMATPLLLGLPLASLHVGAPNLARAAIAAVTGQDRGDFGRGMAELLQLVSERRPSALPPPFVAALREGDLDAVESLLATESFELMVDLGVGGPSYFHPYENRLYVYRDVFFGPLASPLGYLAFAILYFTLAAWIAGGRTPGKWLLGVRVLRLDAFGRAGGYSASLSTLGLGFLEALWDPNRQALHDKIAATVVVRDPGFSPLTIIRRLRSGTSRIFRGRARPRE